MLDSRCRGDGGNRTARLLSLRARAPPPFTEQIVRPSHPLSPVAVVFSNTIYIYRGNGNHGGRDLFRHPHPHPAHPTMKSYNNIINTFNLPVKPYYYNDADSGVF